MKHTTPAHIAYKIKIKASQSTSTPVSHTLLPSVSKRGRNHPSSECPLSQWKLDPKSARRSDESLHTRTPSQQATSTRSGYTHKKHIYMLMLRNLILLLVLLSLCYVVVVVVVVERKDEMKIALLLISKKHMQ
jgi:hypothetical protein